MELDCREFFLQNEYASYDYAFHLAAVVGGRVQIEQQPIAVAADLGIDSAFWQWAVKSKPGKVVTFSSSAAYPIKFQGRDRYRLLKEEDVDFKCDIGMPDMTYGWAKLTSEYLGSLAFERHGIPSVVYRPFSGYGEDQDLSYPFPSIVRRVIESSGGSLAIWGSGEQSRDFVHIEDCIECVLSTMELIDDASALNISTGIFTSFKDLAMEMLLAAGKQAVIECVLDRPEGVYARAGDVTKQRLYGFSPKNNLTEGIRRCFSSYL